MVHQNSAYLHFGLPHFPLLLLLGLNYCGLLDPQQQMLELLLREDRQRGSGGFLSNDFVDYDVLHDSRIPNDSLQLELFARVGYGIGCGVA